MGINEEIQKERERRIAETWGGAGGAVRNFFTPPPRSRSVNAMTGEITPGDTPIPTNPVIPARNSSPIPTTGRADITPNPSIGGGSDPFFAAFPGILPGVQRGNVAWGRDTGAPGPMIEPPIPTRPTAPGPENLNPWERRGVAQNIMGSGRAFTNADLERLYPGSTGRPGNGEGAPSYRSDYTPMGGWGNTASSPTYQPSMPQDPLMGALMDKINVLEGRLSRGSVDARGGSRPALRSDKEMYNHLVGIAGALSGQQMRTGADVFGDVTRANAQMRGQDLTYDAQMQDLLSKAGVNAAHANLMGAQGELFRREAAGMPLDFQQKTGARIAEVMAGQQPTTHSVIPLYGNLVTGMADIAGKGLGDEQTRKAMGEFTRGAIPIVRGGVAEETRAAMMGNRGVDAAALGRYVSDPNSRLFDSIVLPENITTESQAFSHLIKLGLSPRSAMDWIKVRGSQ